MIGMLDGVMGYIHPAQGHGVYFLHNEERICSWRIADRDYPKGFEDKYIWGWWYPRTPEGFTPLSMENV